MRARRGVKGGSLRNWENYTEGYIIIYIVLELGLQLGLFNLKLSLYSHFNLYLKAAAATLKVPRLAPRSAGLEVTFLNKGVHCPPARGGEGGGYLCAPAWGGKWWGCLCAPAREGRDTYFFELMRCFYIVVKLIKNASRWFYLSLKVKTVTSHA